MDLKPNRKILRRMGLSDDQEGIMRRYINEEGSWDMHLKNTKEYIKACIASGKPGSVGILGSGWLLDVPIDFLIENCSHVYLYDIRHPRQIVNKYKNNENVFFIEQDITGGAIEQVYRLIKMKKVKEELLKITSPGFVPAEELDYVVSVNVLNQLDILIVENLRKISGIEDELIRKFRSYIQANHIKSLPTDKSCLITDFEEQLYDRTGKFVESRSLLYSDLPEGKNMKQWVWDFDTRMTYYPNRTTNFKVLAKIL